MVADDEIKLIEAAYHFQCALAGNPRLEDESFKNTQQRANALFLELEGTLQPWAKRTQGNVRDQTVQNLVAAYKQHIGDPNDPAFRAKLLADLNRSAELRKAVPKETDEDRIDRALRERGATKR